MGKTITVRLSDEEYTLISQKARKERRPISNYISHTILEYITKQTPADPNVNAGNGRDRSLQSDPTPLQDQPTIPLQSPKENI